MPKSPSVTAAKRAVVRLGTEPSDLVAEVRTLVGAGVRIDEALLDAAMGEGPKTLGALFDPT